MASSQLPSPREFLVHVREGSAADAAVDLPEGATSAPMDDGSILVELEDAGDPRATWGRLLEHLGSADWISPVVLDGTEEPHFPTGDITVRFEAPLSDTALHGFAESNGLEFRERNEFIAEQVSFRPRDPRGTYLPDLVERLRDDGAVANAWLNTKSAYRRA